MRATSSHTHSINQGNNSSWTKARTPSAVWRTCAERALQSAAGHSAAASLDTEAASVGISLMLRGRRTETRFELRDPRLELLQLFARLQQHLRLCVEFRTGDNVKLGETALEHRFHVLFDVLGG